MQKILVKRSIEKIFKGKKENIELSENFMAVIIKEYQRNTKFNQHILIQICFKIFLLFNVLATKNARYKLFLMERDDLVDVKKKRINIALK